MSLVELGVGVFIVVVLLAEVVWLVLCHRRGLDASLEAGAE